MRDAEAVACGIRLRRLDGSKWAVRGSRQGLFIAHHFPIGNTLVVCEGPTDTAAMLMLGFDAVGRPSCSGGMALIVDLVHRHHFEDVVIMPDSDAPGQRGARYLAARLVGYVPGGVRIVTPPLKDAREWVRSGANRLDVLDAIEAAPLMTLTYGRRAVI
jgi:5S rRNA maturation endonuclease (ribonuclease M5)